MKLKKTIVFLIILYLFLILNPYNTFANGQDLATYQQYYIKGAQHWVNFIETNDKSELSKAIAEFKKAIKENPNFADAYFQLGGIYNIQGKSQEANKMWSKAMELDPDFEQKVDDIDDIKKKRIEPITVPNVEKFIQRISENKEKMQTFSKATSLQLEAQGLMFKGMQTQEDKYYNQALDRINESMDMMPEYAGFCITKAQIYIQTEEYKKAEELLDKAVSLDFSYKELADVMRQNIKILSESSPSEKKKYKEKVGELVKDFKHHEKFLKLGEVEEINRQGKKALAEALLGDESKYDAAIGKFKKAIQILPDDSTSYYNLADAYAYTGNYKEAEEILDKLVEIHPDSADTVEIIKDFYKDLSSYSNYELSKYKREQAEDYLKELGLREKNPHEDEISHHFIKVMKLLANDEEEGNIDKAIELLNQIIEWDPSSAEAYIRLGDVYRYYKNSLDKSIEYYKKAVAIDDNYIEAYEELAYCYEDLGKDELAQQQWKKILEVNPEHEITREKLSE